MFTYLASPYSGTPAQQHERYEQVEKASAILLQKGIPVYSPIVHCHYMSIRHGLPTNFDFWLWYNKAMISTGKNFAILTLPGWVQSQGVQGEYDIALSLSRPIIFYRLEGDKVEQVEKEEALSELA